MLPRKVDLQLSRKLKTMILLRRGIVEGRMIIRPVYQANVWRTGCMVTGKGSYQGRCRVLTYESLIWVIGKDTEVSLDDRLHLVLLPAPCSFRKIATEGLE